MNEIKQEWENLMIKRFGRKFQLIKEIFDDNEINIFINHNEITILNKESEIIYGEKITYIGNAEIAKLPQFAGLGDPTVYFLSIAELVLADDVELTYSQINELQVFFSVPRSIIQKKKSKLVYKNLNYLKYNLEDNI